MISQHRDTTSTWYRDIIPGYCDMKVSPR